MPASEDRVPDHCGAKGKTVVQSRVAARDACGSVARRGGRHQLQCAVAGRMVAASGALPCSGRGPFGARPSAAERRIARRGGAHRPGSAAA